MASLEFQKQHGDYSGRKTKRQPIRATQHPSWIWNTEFYAGKQFAQPWRIHLTGNVTMHLFPNPWNGEGTLTVLYYAQTGEQLEIEIIDLSGRLVYSSSTSTINGAFNKLEIPARLSNGAYLINFREGNLQTTAKLIRY